MNKDDKISELVYEFARLEAKIAGRRVVPEEWSLRDESFRKQFINIVLKYSSMDKLPSPEEAHNSWCQSYKDMGWKYGEVRDVIAKTHPDMVPFDELPIDERDKDEVFLYIIDLAKKILEVWNR